MVRKQTHHAMVLATIASHLRRSNWSNIYLAKKTFSHILMQTLFMLGVAIIENLIVYYDDAVA